MYLLSQSGLFPVQNALLHVTVDVHHFHFAVTVPLFVVRGRSLWRQVVHAPLLELLRMLVRRRNLALQKAAILEGCHALHGRGSPMSDPGPLGMGSFVAPLKALLVGGAGIAVVIIATVIMASHGSVGYFFSLSGTIDWQCSWHWRGRGQR